MKKLITLVLFGTLSISLQAQGIKDRFFQQVGFCFYTDFYYSTPKEHTETFSVSDVNYNYSQLSIKGVTRNQEYSFLSFYYTPRINISETGKDKSIAIEMPIGINISAGIKRFAGEYQVPGGGYNDVKRIEAEYLGSIGFPIYVTYNTGMGSTYASEKETGFSIGLGLDNRMAGFTAYETTDNISLPKVTTMPSIMLGFNRWKNDKAKEIKVKLSYMPSSVSTTNLSTLVSSGFAFSLTFNRFLNF